MTVSIVQLSDDDRLILATGLGMLILLSAASTVRVLTR